MRFRPAIHLPLAAPIGTVLLCALMGRAEAAGGAYVVDDAQIAAPNTCQVESWVAAAGNKDRVFATAPACTVDIVVPVEIKGEVHRDRAGPFWVTTLGLQAKTNLLPIEVGKVGLAVSGAVTFDKTANQVANAAFNVPLTYAASEQLRINVNVGWLHSPAVSRSWATWGVGLEWEFVRRMTLLVEAFGQLGPRLPDQPALTDPRMQAGLRFTPIDAIDIDVIYGRNVTGVQTHWITVGLTTRFGK